MAIQFDVVATHLFFMGEDKVLDFTIFNTDGVTPYDITGLPLEWKLRKTDKDIDPALLTKSIGSGLTIIGAYNASPVINTQRARIVFAPADTTSLKPNVAYRHSLKRLDVGNFNILSFGSFTLLQATEH